MKYNPLHSPDTKMWLALDEGERLEAVREYHRADGFEGREQLHAAFHVVVENQLALDDAPVRETLHRLISEGLNRHEAVHAIASVLAEQVHGLLHGKSSDEDLAQSYYQDLARLRADDWRGAS